MASIRRWLRRRRRKRRRSRIGNIFNPPPVVSINDGPNGTLMFASDELEVNARPDYQVAFYVPVFRDIGAEGAVSVMVDLEDGTAVEGVDYETFTAPILLWNDGYSGTRAIGIRLLSFPNQSKNFFIHLLNPQGGATLDPDLSDMEVTIVPAPGPAGQVGFINPEFNQNESQTITIYAHRFGGSQGAVSVDYATENGTAVGGVDYDSATGTLNWANGDLAPKAITIQLNAVASNKDFFVRLSNPQGGVFLVPSNNPARVTIWNVDAAAAGSLAHELVTIQTVEATTLTIAVKRLGGSNGAVSCNRATSNGTATSGSNYTGTSGTLNWANTDTADKTFNVTILNVSSGQYLNFLNTLSLPGGGASFLTGYDVATIWIYDNGQPAPAPITDLLYDDTYLEEEDILVDDFGYYAMDTHVVFATGQIHNGVIGMTPGTGSFGGSSELVSGDNSLLPSSPLRFQVYEMVEIEEPQEP